MFGKNLRNFNEDFAGSRQILGEETGITRNCGVVKEAKRGLEAHSRKL